MASGYAFWEFTNGEDNLSGSKNDNSMANNVNVVLIGSSIIIRGYCLNDLTKNLNEVRFLLLEYARRARNLR